jgi:hypothetical protein
MIRLSILLSIVMLTIIACGSSHYLWMNEKNAKVELQKALGNPISNKIKIDTLISNKETAVEIAEPILFKKYGKRNIIRQRPYQTTFIEGHWIINGTLPKGWVGGTFVIILKATDAEIIQLTHYK